MLKLIKNLLICPECKHDLSWDIKSEDNNHIINAEIKCTHCNSHYFIENKIACFLSDFDRSKNDSWNENDIEFQNYINNNLEIKDKLLSTSNTKLNGADLIAKAEILKLQGNLIEAEETSALGFSKCYTPDYTNACNSQLSYLPSLLKDYKGLIVDIASGRGMLLEKLLTQTSAPIISTDISYTILKDTYNRLVKNKYEDRVSFIACNAEKLPFKDNSIDILTTYFGLQNMPNSENLLFDIKRVCKNSFYAISIFYDKNNKENYNALKEFKLDNNCIEENLMSEFKKASFSPSKLNSIKAYIEPTPTGEVLAGMTVDGFPIASTYSDFCIIEGKK